MSFFSSKKTISEGDLVVLYLGANNLHCVIIEPLMKSKRGNLVENVFQSSYGSLKIMDLIGHCFGDRVSLSRGWIALLRPTPQLWTLTLPHRTQILYLPDISLVLSVLQLTPGNIVCEAGTGSGSLSHALIRSVMPNGHVYTCEFHELRADTVTKEFTRHGLSEFVTCAKRDVCTEGFGVSNIADAVFLDLPKPWECVDHVIAAINKERGGKVCCFSPCVEQVQRTHTTLKNSGFMYCTTVECLTRDFSVHKTRTYDVAADVENTLQDIITTSPFPDTCGHTGYLTHAIYPPRVQTKLLPFTECL